jgi:hypothetical protein
MVRLRLGGSDRRILCRYQRGSPNRNWEESDQIRIAVLKLTEAARLFYNGSPELHEKDVTWQKFKCVSSQRFRDTHTDRHHFMQLQTDRQKKNETL